MVDASPLNIVHIGLVVDDLEAAVEAHGRLGLTFIEPVTYHIDRLVDADGAEEECDLRIAFSHQGPPYIELVEATGHGIYGSQHVGAIHHLAVLVPDAAARRAELLGSGARAPATVYDAEGNVALAYVEAPGGAGARLELLETAAHEAVLGWIEADRPPA